MSWQCWEEEPIIPFESTCSSQPQDHWLPRVTAWVTPKKRASFLLGSAVLGVPGDAWLHIGGMTSHLCIS